MAKTMKLTSNHDETDARRTLERDALEWLAGQLRWERILDRLQREALDLAPVRTIEGGETSERAA
jgi:hypothetical protein